MSKSLPKHTKAIVLKQSPRKGKDVYHDVTLESRSIPELKQGEILVRMGAVAFNHREEWIRKGLYPSIAFNTVIGADGAGTVIAAADPHDTLLNRRVFLIPIRGWEKDELAPESRFGTLGGCNYPLLGTFAQYVVLERDQVILTPDHVDDVHISAWPTGGLTAWRAVTINGKIKKGQNVLVTGAGGGVAIVAVQICVALGANVYVTSGSEDKIKRAIALGAKGGVNYRGDWVPQLASLLAGKSLDCVIDSAGGEIMQQLIKLLKQGGRVVCYGMTADTKIPVRMGNVLKQHKLIGSTMGSRKDLQDATAFLSEHKIVPVVSDVLQGLESTEAGFEILRKGDQFGKIVIQLSSKPGSKL